VRYVTRGCLEQDIDITDVSNFFGCRNSTSIYIHHVAATSLYLASPYARDAATLSAQPALCRTSM
jgi:hypothetical protein